VLGNEAAGGRYQNDDGSVTQKNEHQSREREGSRGESGRGEGRKGGYWREGVGVEVEGGGRVRMSD